MRYILIVLLLGLQSTLLYTQTSTISGYVRDEQSKKKLIHANVFLKNSKRGTTTNDFGFYSINCPKNDTVTLIVSYIGYKIKAKKIFVSTDRTLNFDMRPGASIDSVKITENTFARKDLGQINIPLQQLKTLPALGGIPDLMKAYQLMPGIQSGNEGSSNLFVRGGNADENLVLLDDIPLYYVNHLGGFISVFNTDALNSVKVIKGGFPAKYGSRLSSVLDIRMKEGSMKEYHGNVSIGILNTKFSLEGPVKKDTSSFLLSLRGLPWEFLLRPIQALNREDIFGYNYYDINAKINYKINRKNRLYLSFYRGDDNAIRKINSQFTNKERKFIFRWGNQLGAIRWNHIFSSNLFSNTTLAVTRYRNMTKYDFNHQINDSKYYYKYYNQIRDIILKTDMEYSFRKNYRLKFGLNSILHGFNPGTNTYKTVYSGETEMDTTFGFNKLYVPENRLYIENIIRLNETISGNLGFHSSLYSVNKQNYFSLQPRLILNFDITENFSVKSSYSRMHQYTHLLTSSRITFPSDIWVPSTKKIKPSESQQISVGLHKDFLEEQLHCKLIGYHKQSTGLISYKEGASLNGVATQWENKIETGGRGEASGIEFLLQKTKGKTNGWIAYTYAKSKRQFDHINNGKWFPFKYDRRHDISIAVNHNFSEKIKLSATWIYGSGYPYTLPVAHHQVCPDIEDKFYPDSNIYIYGNTNEQRMKDYHRFDLCTHFKKKKKKGIRIWTISVYNTYNRKNPYFYFSEIKDGKMQLYQQSLFPIIPSISYSYKF